MRSARSILLGLTNRIRPNRLSWFSTIRARLYCAFGFSAVLTLVGSFTALYEFTTIRATTHEILSRSCPATVVSLRRAEEVSSLVSSAPRLMTAADDKTRIEVINGISRQKGGLAEGKGRLLWLGI